MSIEAGVVIDVDGQPIHWHTPPNRNGGALPDSRDLWEVFWENRARVRGFAHSHPGSGLPSPSYTDTTTFRAIELALGKRLDWWILSADGYVLLRWEGPGDFGYQKALWAAPVDGLMLAPEDEPPWAPRLRELSHYPPRLPTIRPKRYPCPDCQGSGLSTIGEGDCLMCAGDGFAHPFAS